MTKLEVSQSIEIDCPPEQVFEHLSDFQTWTSWSPWLCVDPAAKTTVTINSNSIGSRYEWQGEIVGQGELEHRFLDRPKLIEQDLRFFKPHRSQAKTNFRIEPTQSGSLVTWDMKSSLPWFMFWMKNTMVDMIGMDYDRGLKMVKEQLEKGHVSSQSHIRGITLVGPFHAVVVQKSCTAADISPSIESSLSQVAQQLKLHHQTSILKPLAIYSEFNARKQSFFFRGGFLVDSLPASLPVEFEAWTSEAMKVFHVQHVGSYEHLGNSWSAVYQHVRHQKLKQTNIKPFEIYRNDPANTPESELVTDIYMPIR